MFSVINFTPKAVDELINAKADVNIQRKDGKTALMLAFNRLPDYYNRIYNDEETCAKVQKEDTEKIVHNLLTAAADINAKDALHKYAADYAKICTTLDRDTANRLVRRLTPNIIELSDGFGLARYGTIKDIQASINAGFSFNISDDKGYTPLHDAVANNLRVESVKLILSQGTDINAVDAYGLSPLMWAARSNPETKIIEFLLALGADVSTINRGGDSALS